MTPSTVLKLATLRQPFARLIARMLEEMEREHILYLVGDCYRSPADQLLAWGRGRTLRDGGDTQVASDWTVIGATVTNAHPSSGKNPHLYGLAVDIYAKDPNSGKIMDTKHPQFWQIIYRMWAIAESLGIDALGHKTDQPGDQVWRDDPCHFQMLNWPTMKDQKETTV